CEIYKSTRSVVAKSEFQNFIKVLTSNAGTKDGLKPYVFVYDELHAAKDGELWRVLDEGTINRANPLSIIISTAGYNLAGEMKRKYDYAKQVEQGIIKDDSFYSMIFEADSAKWQDEREWLKANPALGYGVQLENLRTKYAQTIGNAENEMSFKTKHLNIWCNSSKAWINDDIWCAAPSLKELGILDFTRLQKELEWYGGLDLSSTGDITAYTLIAKFEGLFIVKPFFWLPSDNAQRRARNDRVPYIDWINKGLITATEGNVVDYAYLKSDIEDINSEFNIKATAYDRWNTAGIIAELAKEGLDNFTPFGQGFGSMSQPAKEIYALAMKKQLVHDGNPVLRWMISNVEILTDPAGNIKLAKNKSREKIDGVVALVMAYGVYSMMATKETSTPSVRILEF
ncbi:MAG: terminase TerL endonuclease subunit, partial [Campylobacter sp.]|uniref:terminase large subunit n=1 Tax=Campylobacter sp. TaxID=205 RepID=UPI002A912F87